VGLKFTLEDAGRTYLNIVKVNKSVADPKVFCERKNFVVQSGAFTCIVRSINWML